MTEEKLEKLEFSNGRDFLNYTVQKVISENDEFIIFLDKFGEKVTIAKKFISRRWFR